MSSAESVSAVKLPPEKKKLTNVLLLATLASSFGNFQSGYSLWMVHNPAAIVLEFPNSTFEMGPVPLKFRQKLLKLGIVVFHIGGVLGALLVGYLVNTWGRKGALVVNNCLNIFAGSFMGLSKLVHILKFSFLARFMIGVSSGIFSSSIPLYIEEISPPKLRGGLYMVSFLSLTFGTLVAQLVSLREGLETTTGLSFLMSFTGIMAAFNITILHYFPESPRFLFIQKKNESAARQALIKLRGDKNVEEELEDMHQEDLCEQDEKYMSMSALLHCQKFRRNLLSAVVLLVGNQLTGLNGVYFYAEKIYISLGLEGSHIRFMLVAVNSLFHVVMLVMVAFVDSVGRRFFLLVGFMVCSMVCILLVVVLEFQIHSHPVMAYFSIFLVIVFLIGHMIGPAPIPYLVTGELFLQSTRGLAYAVGGFMNWFIRLLVVATFGFIEVKTGPYSLLIFWPTCIGVFVYVFKMVPETRGRTFLEIWKGIVTPTYPQKKSEHKRIKSEHKRSKEKPSVPSM